MENQRFECPTLSITVDVLLYRIFTSITRLIPSAIFSKEQKITPTPDPQKYTGSFSYYNLQKQVIKEGPGGVLLMENPQAPDGRYNTTGLSYVDEGVFRMKILGE